MGVNTQQYVRKPLYVDAIRVTTTNFDEVAAWCQGEVTEEIRGSGTPKKCIKVRVQYPKNPRQTQAFVGDWVLYTERGYKVYTNKAFKLAFDLVEEPDPSLYSSLAEPVPDAEPGSQLTDAPPPGGDMFPPDEGPRRIADAKAESVSVVAEEPSQATGVQPIHSVESAVDEHTTPQGEPHEYVEAAPETIADAVNEQQPEAARCRHGHLFTERCLVCQREPTRAIATDKRVLSQEEQNQMGPDEVREMVRSGDAVLIQDLAESA